MILEAFNLDGKVALVTGAIQVLVKAWQWRWRKRVVTLLA